MTIEIPERLRPYRFILLKPRAKVPFETDWTTRANYAWDDPKLQAHISAGGNYGVLCGGETSRLLVIDADSPSVRDAVEAQLPPTFTAMTGRLGTHYYYETDSLMKTVPLSLDDGSNVGHLKAEGSQVVAPGSQHENGKFYIVGHDRPIAKIAEEQVLYILRGYTGVAKKARDWRNLELSPNTGAPVLKDATVEAVICKWGDEHPGKLSGIQKLSDGYLLPHPLHGSTTGSNLHINTAGNYWYCFRCGSGGGPASLIALLEGVKPCAELKSGGLRGAEFKRAMDFARVKYELESTVPAPIESRAQADERMPFEVAEELLKDGHFATDLDTDHLYTYREGIYRPLGETYVKDAVVAMSPCKSEHFANEVIYQIRSRTHHEAEEFDPDPDVVPLLNGLYRVSTGTLEAFTPGKLYVHQLPVKYVEGADCPLIKKFISEVVRDEDAALLQEIVGYCLLRNYKFQKAVMLTGSGANGKGVFLHLLINFLGPENTSAVSLQDLEGNRFKTAELRGRLANIHADLTPRSIGNLGIFKLATGEDFLEAEEKFGKSFRFKNHAKMLFSANKVPEIKEDTDAVYRRWLVIDFPNTFYGARRDVDLLQRLLSPAELSGFFNWAVVGLRRLVTKGEFSKSPSTEETRAQYQRMASPLRAFVDDCIGVDPNGWVAKDDLFRYFMEYCDKHGLPRPSKTQVGHDLPRYAVSVRDERRRTGGTMERGWQGIKYTSEEEQKHESDSQREGPTLDDWQAAEDPPSRRD